MTRKPPARPPVPQKNAARSSSGGESPRRAPAKNELRIVKAEFEKSLPDFKSLPRGELPEIAFLGRSNVGKSSLLNALCERKALARVSKTPGRTQTFNFYRLEFEAEKKRIPCHFVDLPGYGYAVIDKATRRRWSEMIGSYVLDRENLQMVLLLIDSRRSPGEEERYIAEIGREGNLVVVLTKCDKLSQNELRSAMKKMSAELGLPEQRVLPSSILRDKHDRTGALREFIFESALTNDDR
ncbi:MAG: ribosome biogenesis GTP-binding protein YihA/YsxC [Bdellovibrionota bacterium]